MPVTAARKGSPIIMTGNATSVKRDIPNIPPVPVTVARWGIRFIMMDNATSVPKDITSIPPVPVSVVLRGTRIITTGSAGTGNKIGNWISGLMSHNVAGLH